MSDNSFTVNINNKKGSLYISLIVVLLACLIVMGFFAFPTIMNIINPSPASSNPPAEALEWKSDPGDQIVVQVMIQDVFDSNISLGTMVLYNMTNESNLDTTIPINENLTFYNWTVGVFGAIDLNGTFPLQYFNFSDFNFTEDLDNIIGIFSVPFAYGNYDAMESMLVRNVEVIAQIANFSIINNSASHEEIVYYTIPMAGEIYGLSNILNGYYHAVRYDHAFCLNDTTGTLNMTMNIKAHTLYECHTGILLQESYEIFMFDYTNMLNNLTATLSFQTVASSSLISNV